MNSAPLNTQPARVVRDAAADATSRADRNGIGTVIEVPFGAKNRTERSMAERKLRLLRRSGLFGDDTKGATIERACTVEDLCEAYRLVHDVYLGTGFIHPERSGLRLRIFETTSETATFVAKVGDRVVGVLSIVGDSPDLGLPSDVAFKDELDRLRATGCRVCEVTNQAVAEEYRKSAVPTELMKCAVTHALKAGYHAGVATVSPSHFGFYDLLGFRQLGAERSYSTKLHDPVVALMMDINWYRHRPENMDETQMFIHDFMTEGNRFLVRVTEWAKVARRNFLNPELLEQLFVRESDFIVGCSPQELRILHRRWGQEIFETVTANLFTSVDGILAEMLQFPDFSRQESASQLYAVGTATPFPDRGEGTIGTFGSNLHRFASAARDHITTPFLNLLNWSETTGEVNR